jgi:hypothetical protein
MMWVDCVSGVGVIYYSAYVLLHLCVSAREHVSLGLFIT